MLRDFWNILLALARETGNKIRVSRLFLLGTGYAFLIAVMVARLYHLQILNGEDYLKNYIQKTERTVGIPATRGNIFDCKGKLLAYNRLSYTVTVQDTGDYKSTAERNTMYYRLVQILNKHQEKITGQLEIAVNDAGEYYFTSPNESARKRFLRDIYGLKSVDELTGADGKYPADITAEALILQKVKSYRLDRLTDESGEPVTLTPLETVQLVNIRYTMGLTAYKRYESTTLVENVREETRAELMENQALLLGVDCPQTTERVYNDAIPFSSIIGYVGKVQEDQLARLQESGMDYSLNDTVGRTGIEEYMEKELHGSKGSRTIYVDNVGHVMEVKSETAPVAGNDVYLSIDRDLQVGIYHILEQHLAGVLVAKLVNEDDPNTDRTDSTARRIPIKDAYYQLIANNVLSLSRMHAADASATEKQIAGKLDCYLTDSLSAMRETLMNPTAPSMAELPDDQRAFLYFL